jgi:hypothetical protein
LLIIIILIIGGKKMIEGYIAGVAIIVGVGIVVGIAFKLLGLTEHLNEIN